MSFSKSVHKEGTTNHHIIQRPNTPYTSTFPDPYHQGVINPLKKRTVRRNLNIDTRFRENYSTTSSTDFQITLPCRLTNVVSMELSAIEFCCSFYNISSYIGNNYMTIRRTIDGTEYTMVIVIPDGNYIGSDLINYLNNYTTEYTDAEGNQYFQGINFFLDSNMLSGGNSGSGRMVISSYLITASPPLTYPLVPPGPDTNVPPETGYDFVVDFNTDIYGNPDNSTPLQRRFGWFLGYREGSYGSTTASSEYVSDAVLDMSGFKYLYLIINDFNNNVNNNFYGAYKSSLANENVLARLSINSSFFALDSQSSVSTIVSQPREYFGPVIIQRLQIQMMDEFGKVIDMNNMDFSFALTLEVMYDL